MCPICSSGPVKEGDLLEVIVKDFDAGEEKKAKVVVRKNDFVSSTKTDALLRNLRETSDPFDMPHPDTLVIMQDGSVTKIHTSERWSSPNSRPSWT